MITEDYVSYEVAKLLKEKGFDAPCRSYYIDYEDYIDFWYCNDELTDLQMGVWERLRPTHQMAMKWLRESHNLQIQITPVTSRHKDWTFGISIDFSPLTIDLLCFPTYEETVEAALKYVLKNLI